MGYHQGQANGAQTQTLGTTQCWQCCEQEEVMVEGSEIQNQPVTLGQTFVASDKVKHTCIKNKAIIVPGICTNEPKVPDNPRTSTWTFKPAIFLNTKLPDVLQKDSRQTVAYQENQYYSGFKKSY